MEAINQLLLWFLAAMAVFSGRVTVAEAQELQAGMNRVAFESEGTVIAGNVYLPPTYKRGDKIPAIIVGGSWTTVKEQMAGLYAQRLAGQGFAALAFDHRYWGESGGEPRQLESGAAKTKDFKNAVTFLQSLPMIDPDRIGGLAVCASASYMAAAIAEDPRFKAFVTVAAWFQHPESTPLFYGGAEGVKRRVDLGNEAMAKFRKTKKMDYVPAYDPKDPNAAMFFELDYYANPGRGAVPQWKNEFAVASWPEWLQLNAIDGIVDKITVPSLFIHSDQSALPANVRRVYELVKGPKEMHWSNQGTQTDYYDQPLLVDKAVALAALYFNQCM